ncbi:MAG: FTR1 family iron permease [Bacillota bacterium]
MKVFRKAAVLILVFYLFSFNVYAATSWNEVVNEIDEILVQAVAIYEKGDIELAVQKVNDGYFGPYEGKQMEKAVRLSISSKYNAEIEYMFRSMKKAMKKDSSVEEVNALKEELVEKLYQAAKEMDKASQSPWGTFVASLLIIVREGFEAILVIGALIAYLIQSGNKDKLNIIYISSAGALAASVVTAIAIKMIFNVSGASQEILEGITMLVAVVVLFFVSYWLISKSEAQKWDQYIKNKMTHSLSKGNKFALGFAAFLAVYREGAETVLFYQAMIYGSQPDEIGTIALGFAVGCVVLVGLFALIRYGGVKIPLKPFFLGTSVLLYYLAFVFAGQAINELQAGNLIASTAVNFPTITLLGIYPTVESLLLQGLLLAAVLLGWIYRKYQNKKIIGG